MCSQIWLLLAVCCLRSCFFVPSVWICSTCQSPHLVGITSARTAYKDTGRVLNSHSAPYASRSSAGGRSSKLTPSYQRWLLGSRSLWKRKTNMKPITLVSVPARKGKFHVMSESEKESKILNPSVKLSWSPTMFQTPSRSPT